MKKMKYVTYTSIFGVETFVIGSPLEKHANLAAVTVPMRILGAGFIDMETFECSGKSVGLGVESRGDADTEIIKSFLFADY